MTSLQQIQQDIQTLPPEALNLVAQFIQLLQKTFTTRKTSSPTDEVAATPDTEDWSDFIGCMSAEEDLSINYKAYWAAGLEEKYGHR